jgi:hypothetical protein
MSRRSAFQVGVVVVCTFAAGAVISGRAAGIVPETLLEHIKFLSADDLKGRGNGTEGLERASEYVAGQFAKVGLQPGGVDQGWYQPFELIAGLAVGPSNSLSVSSGNDVVTFVLGTSYYPLAAPANESTATPSTDLRDLQVVFAGYGIDVRDVGYDDYASVDVRGKAALIFSHEPQETDARSRLNGAEPLTVTTLQAKASLARRHGARLLLVVGDPTHRRDQAPYGLWNGDPDAEDQAIPVLRVRRQEAQALIDAWRLDDIARQIDGDLVPRSRVLPGVTVSYLETLSKNRRIVRNVVGILPGSDPARAAESIVVGAHYDHVGLGGRLSVTPDRTGEIHNGADDNASGTASIIEIARAAVANPARFPRTLVFVAFAGEERGLLGSAHYASHPPMPIGGTIAMLNLDMVGRARGGVDVSGLEVSPSMEADLTAAVAASGGELRIGRQGPGAGRSDDYTFIARRIPAINFFTGFHADYHRPGDDWEKIDAVGTMQVSTLAYELAAKIAARDARPEFTAK